MFCSKMHLSDQASLSVEVYSVSFFIVELVKEVTNFFKDFNKNRMIFPKMAFYKIKHVVHLAIHLFVHFKLKTTLDLNQQRLNSFGMKRSTFCDSFVSIHFSTCQIFFSHRVQWWNDLCSLDVVLIGYDNIILLLD